MPRLSEKVILITGGESGIGLATARLFAAEGARLHLVGIDEERLADAARELDALTSVADVADEDAVRCVVGDGVERYGRYDVLFSNAGISGEVVPIEEYPSDVFARVLAVHVLGTFHVLKHALPHVPDGGSIIITSSAVGLIGTPRLSAYVAAKHAQVGLMRAAAKELARHRIRVNTIHSGPTETALQADIELRATGKGARGGGAPVRPHGPVRPPHEARRDRPGRALSGVRRERHGHVAHADDRRRHDGLSRGRWDASKRSTRRRVEAQPPRGCVALAPPARPGRVGDRVRRRPRLLDRQLEHVKLEIRGSVRPDCWTASPTSSGSISPTPKPRALMQTGREGSRTAEARASGLEATAVSQPALHAELAHRLPGALVRAPSIRTDRSRAELLLNVGAPPDRLDQPLRRFDLQLAQARRSGARDRPLELGPALHPLLQVHADVLQQVRDPRGAHAEHFGDVAMATELRSQQHDRAQVLRQLSH